VSTLRFIWDPAKARANERKHGISFEEACSVFEDHLGAPSRAERASRILEEREAMRKRYDFGEAKPNPYARRLKKPVTIRIDEATLAYFQALAEKLGVPYQSLINLYLRDAARRELVLRWSPASARDAG
jgi:uncharacterized protein (DUF4415 family)